MPRRFWACVRRPSTWMSLACRCRIRYSALFWGHIVFRDLLKADYGDMRRARREAQSRLCAFRIHKPQAAGWSGERGLQRPHVHFWHGLPYSRSCHAAVRRAELDARTQEWCVGVYDLEDKEYAPMVKVVFQMLILAEQEVPLAVDVTA